MIYIYYKYHVKLEITKQTIGKLFAFIWGVSHFYDSN